MSKKHIIQVYPAGSDQPSEYNGKKYTNFGILVRDENGGEMPEKGSLYGDKVQFVNELAAKGKLSGSDEIEIEVVDKDTFFNTKDNKGVLACESFGKLNLKWPWVQGQGGGRSGGGGWKGGGGRPYGGGGGYDRGYKGKAMTQAEFTAFCATTFAESVEAVKGAIPKIGDDKLAEVAQSLTATKLIAMQHGMAYPVGHEPVAQSQGGGVGDSTPSVDQSKAVIKDYLVNIGDCSTQAQCTMIRDVINKDDSLSEDERVFLRTKVMEQQKAVA